MTQERGKNVAKLNQTDAKTVQNSNKIGSQTIHASSKNSADHPPTRKCEAQDSWSNFIARFEFIAQQFPDATAILSNGEEHISYDALREKARRFAAYLQAQKNAEPQTNQDEPRVALFFEKSPEYIIALLGCWYAGMAFTPICPTLPKARIDSILEALTPDFIILQNHDIEERVAPSLEQPQKQPPLYFADTQDTKQREIAQNLFYDHRAPDDYDGRLAYIIFTSGSTGTPKGVMVNHGGLPNLLSQQIDAFDVQPGDRSLFLLSISFDASLSDIGCTLLSGACLCIESPSNLETASNIQELVHQRDITHIDIPPSMLRLLEPKDMPKSLRSLIIGGEVCPFDTVRKWAAHLRLTNVYGPTEATVCTSMVRCNPDQWNRPLIGDAMQGVEYRIEDGELLIGGIQLARGYLNRPDLNAERFVTLDGTRYYRSGDHVKQHEDGAISFLGRFDRQIKIRGQLVDIEDIEVHLAAHPDIARSCITARKDAKGKNFLIAFYQRKDAADITEIDVQAWLRPRLPEWMIPQFSIKLDHFPLTASGKIDTGKLADIPHSHTNKPQNDEALTPLEAQIIGIFRTVLKTDAVNAQDSLFAIGGDSIDVIEICILAEKAGLAISPSFVAEHPSVSAIASALDARRSDGKTQDMNGSMSAEELRTHACLPEDIRGLIHNLASQATPRAAHQASEKTDQEHVFFTGATGFLGARLLSDLLKRTSWSFTCLVRAGSAEEAQKRIIRAFDAQALTLTPDYFVNGRIKAICGDLSDEKFGQSDAQWAQLTQECDNIIHCAAIVNMVKDFTSLASANLTPCFDLLRLALTHKVKPVHYMSTLSVFVSSDQNTGRVFEEDMLTHTKHIYGGYAQSKWAAEIALHSVPFDICPITSYRLGLITGDSKTGIAPDRDFLGLFVQGLQSLKNIPTSLPDGRNTSSLKIDVTPIDYASSCLARIITDQRPQQPVYHIANEDGFTLPQIADALTQRGVSFRRIPPLAWAQLPKEKSAMNLSEQAAYFGLCRCLPTTDYERLRGMDLFQATDIAFDMTHLKARGFFACPPADDALLSLYLDRILQAEESEVA